MAGFAMGDQAAIATQPRDSAGNSLKPPSLSVRMTISSSTDQPDEQARELGHSRHLDLTGGAVAILDIST